MITFTDKGIYCHQGRFYIDPWKPVKYAVITHGHSDHARPGSSHYLCHTDTVPVLRLRLGDDVSAEGIDYGESRFINGVEVSLHPAGHIPGSAQIRVAYKGEIWVISGDYKLAADGVSVPYEPVRCQHFVTESTFGLPIYNFEPPETVLEDINQWWAQNASEGINTVIAGYALGKSQVILNGLDRHCGPILLHGAVANVNEALMSAGYHFPGTRVTGDTITKGLQSAIIIAPPSALGTPWMRKWGNYRVAMCSGWMSLRGARRRLGVDRGFVLSDHCDWKQLNTAISGTGARHIYVTHGYEGPFARWLNEQYPVEAREVKTLFNETEMEDI